MQRMSHDIVSRNIPRFKRINWVGCVQFMQKFSYPCCATTSMITLGQGQENQSFAIRNIVIQDYQMFLLKKALKQQNFQLI